MNEEEEDKRKKEEHSPISLSGSMVTVGGRSLAAPVSRDQEGFKIF